MNFVFSAIAHMHRPFCARAPYPPRVHARGIFIAHMCRIRQGLMPPRYFRRALAHAAQGRAFHCSSAVHRRHSIYRGHGAPCFVTRSRQRPRVRKHAHLTSRCFTAPVPFLVVSFDGGFLIDHCHPFGATPASSNSCQIGGSMKGIWNAETGSDTETFKYEDDLCILIANFSSCKQATLHTSTAAKKHFNDILLAHLEFFLQVLEHNFKCD